MRSYVVSFEGTYGMGWTGRLYRTDGTFNVWSEFETSAMPMSFGFAMLVWFGVRFLESD